MNNINIVTPQSQNPLKKYFREAKIQISLPSRNKYYPPGMILDPAITGEIGILPMTAMDELVLKNPDALLNGEAVEKVIRSVAPQVTNVRNLLMCDVEAILFAMRFSTQGAFLKIESTCPKCSTVNEVSVNIRERLETAPALEDSYSVMLSNKMTIFIKPYAYEMSVRAALKAFEQAKSLSLVQQDNKMTDEDKLKILNESFNTVNSFNTTLMIQSIVKIVTPDGIEVTDQVHIAEFIRELDASSFESIQALLEKVNKISVNKEFKVTCSNESCKHEYTGEIGLDPSNFFARS